ncbi:imidazole glycerol phosphate synthase subunit HisF [Candidatus Methanoplasma termitum]|uniref:Imidazole glycerol phosphate synthase subunit HisF n=1 Tax=Candidatus Methanoplasma termitum TaxID=1577791 RepID=A0A0A7LCY8_9ARCH|nr:imidazole glycerol phosphate synthase subunit HisF [Candidatus Methanoplasma termitum]AIZ56137.1 imidazole glycerol phosphate synthase subunit HisF [Candidatus Methanoplasma termitum]MCL2333474.1 imidazole glycerol phosphate synthase subunit HisF [Candidatus Methanoplasma sp.]
MLKKRIIPCLDVKNGKVVKGINFMGMKDLGSPPDMAEEYSEQGADEVTFLDIAASLEYRQTTLDLVSVTAKRVFVPLTVGGGIRTANDMHDALKAGADKVSVNSAAISNPNVISESAERFGRQCVVVAIDAKKVGRHWEVFTHGGMKPSGLDAIDWAKKAEDLGAGEILLTSIDADGVKQGYDIPLTEVIADEVSIPVIASGGCGKIEDFYEVFSQTNVSAALAASVFHYKQVTVREVKEYLKDRGVPVR